MNNTSLNENHSENDLTLNGIGGWLILLAIGVVLNPIILLASLVSAYLPIILNGTLFKLNDTRISLFILFEFIGNITILIFSIIIIYKFFKKNIQFPKLQIIFYISIVLFLIIDNVLALLIIKNTNVDTNIIRVAVTAIIWSSYLLNSRRVKNTFINS